MATRKPKPAEAAGDPTFARALIDLDAHGVKAGQLLQAEAEVIAALSAIGAVDAHPDAVASAREQE